jgi:hypothetical protein
MDGWPQRAVEGELAAGMASFFKEFWRRLGDDLRRRAPEEFHKLEALLDETLEANGLTAFYPESIRDWDSSWLTFKRHEGLLTGRVSNVLQPGLREDKRLWLKAIVEVE